MNLVTPGRVRKFFWHAARFLLLAAPPIGFLLLVLAHRPGPLGAGYVNDPDFYYVFAGYRVAAGHLPFFMDHPGIPAQLLAGALVWLRWQIAPIGEPDLLREVMLHSERYHAYLGISAALMNTAALAGLAWWMRRAGYQIWNIVSCLIAFLSLHQLIHFSGRFLPEGLMVAASVAGGVFWLRSWQGEGRDAPVRAGLLLGLVCSLKMNFLPFAALGLAFRRWWRPILFIIFAAASYYAISFALPPDRQATLFRYFGEMTIRRGMYASGEVGVPPWQELWDNVFVLRNEGPLALNEIVLILLISTVVTLRSFFWGDLLAARRLIAGWLVVVGTFLLTLKHPSVRYLLPAMAFFPILLAAYARFEPRPVLRCLPYLFLAAGFWFSLPEYQGHLGNLRLTKRGLADWERQSRPHMEMHSQCMLLLDATVPTQEWANISGFSANGGYFAEELRQIFPRLWTFELGHQRFSTYGLEEQHKDKFLRKHASGFPCIVYLTRRDLGPGGGRGLFPELKWKVLTENGAYQLLFVNLPAR